MATTLPDAVAATGASETEAQFKTFVLNTRAALAEMGDPTATFGRIQNLSLSLTVAGNALTIAVKDRAGADPTATAPSSPATATFRNATVATGDFSVLNLTAANSLVVSSGSTLGTRNTVPFRLWIVAFNDAGTWRLGVINCLTTVAGAGAGSDVTAIFPLKGWAIATSTAEGGAGAADSAQTFYTGTAVTSKAYMVLGYATWETGLATAGTWSSGPTRVQLFGPAVPLPGDIIQVPRTPTGAVATGTTTTPFDDTIPQNTEGDQYITQAITPSSAANVLRTKAQFMGSSAPGTAYNFIIALHQDATANALAAMADRRDVTTGMINMSLESSILAAATAATTMKLRAGCASAGTTTFNGQVAGRLLGGVAASFLQVEEMMG